MASLKLSELQKSVDAIALTMNPPEYATRNKTVIDNFRQSPDFEVLTDIINPLLRRNDAVGPKIWMGTGLKCIEVPDEDACLKAIGKLQVITDGWDKVYTLQREGQQLVVKVQQIENWELQEPVGAQHIAKRISNARLAGQLGVGPQIHEAFICFNKTQHKLVLMMDRIDGESWKDWTANASQKVREQALSILRKKLDILHEHRLVHNALSERNVMVVGNVTKVKDVLILAFESDSKDLNSEQPLSRDEIEYLRLKQGSGNMRAMCVAAELVQTAIVTL